MTKAKISLSLLTLLMFGINSLAFGSNWAEAPTEITVQEFLEGQFRESMSRGESEYINSFNIVSFYPSSSPQTALIFIVQTWHDSLSSNRNLKREIRKIGDAAYGHFSSMIGHPVVKKRWKLGAPNKNFIIKHVRYSDLDEVLAVTIDKKTYFDDNDIKKASSLVRQRGGVWAF